MAGYSEYGSDDAGGAVRAMYGGFRGLPGVMGRGLTKIGTMGFAPPAAGTPQQQGQAMAPKPSPATPQAFSPPPPDPSAQHPMAHAFGRVLGRAFGGPGEEEKMMGRLSALPDRPGIGVKPPPAAYGAPGIAQAQVPQGGFENRGDPGHQLHPLLRNALSNPAASMSPQYTSQTFDRVPGEDYNPYPGLAMIGHRMSLPASPMMHPAQSGPSGHSQAELAMQAMHAQSGFTHAQGQAEMSHGMAQKYLSDADNPAGIPRGQDIATAERLGAMRTGVPVQHTPWEGNAALSAAVASPNFNVGMLRRAAQATGINVQSPQGMDIVRQILAIKGIDPEEEYQSNSGGRNPLNGIEFGGGALPWFPNFRHYQSPESQQNQQFLQTFRR